jgi:release factor glutamine methyltransferase
MPQFSAVYAHIINQLSAITEKGEAQGMARILISHFLSVSSPAFVNPSMDVNESSMAKINHALNRIRSGEPIQYVLGKTRFLDFDFIVKPGVLIPRPETEELTDFILKNEKKDATLKVLDIGSGSGCIALSLALKRPLWTLHALEYSNDALQIFLENQKELKVHCNVHPADMTKMPWFDQPLVFDVFVSNPPYILPEESQSLAHHVLHHEPHAALFVPGKDALYFYKAIVEAAKFYLTSGGRIYLETHRDYAEAVASWLEANKFTSVKVKHDLYGNPRFVFGEFGGRRIG